MRYKLLGNSGLRVSEVALGTMACGEDWGWGADRDECRRILDAYRAAGGNFIDTADKYTDGSTGATARHTHNEARGSAMTRSCVKTS